jgi:hypothetical protein
MENVNNVDWLSWEEVMAYRAEGYCVRIFSKEKSLVGSWYLCQVTTTGSFIDDRGDSYSRCRLRTGRPECGR